MACANYQADVLAVGFGQCKCGYPKQAHVIARVNKAAAAKRALRSSTREVPKLQCEPCSEYVVDVSASTFGHCYCGHPKEAHVIASENKAAVAKRALRSSTREVPNLQCEPCSEYVVDVSASTFGHCYCGHPKEAHVIASENKAAAAKRALRSSTREVPKLQCEPCSEYVVDVSASTFGHCYCGHPKEAHLCKSENPAEAALRVMKENNAGKMILREESDPNTENVVDDISANLCEENSDPDIEDNAMVETSTNVESKLNRFDKKPILILPLRYDFGFGMRCCSVCGSFCRNRGCEDSNQVFCHRCWPNYICGNDNDFV